MITDKDVGELWRETLACTPEAFITDMQNLVRKLVEERAWRHWDNIPKALRDFGIDPATWKEPSK